MRNYGDLLGKAEKLVNCGLLENFLKERGCRVSQGGNVPSVPPKQLVMITVFAAGTHSWCLLGVIDERKLSPGTSLLQKNPYKTTVFHKGDQSWVFFGRTDAKAETPVLWPPHAKS